MPSLTLIDSSQFHVDIPKELYEGHRHLTSEEIKILVSNGNTSEDSAWLNVLVSDGKGLFDANLMKLAFIIPDFPMWLPEMMT